MQKMSRKLAFSSILCLIFSPLLHSDPPSKKSESSTSSTSETLTRYLNLLKGEASTLTPLASWRKGEIEIITQPEQIKKIENQMRLRLICNGVPEKDATEWSRVGIVAEDQYLIWIRDGVIFPSGVYGTYDRVVWRNGLQGPPGVAVMPVLANKKIVVNLYYRHATRNWEIELPRGGKKENETLEQAALRELREETGYKLAKSLLLGTMAPDSGILTSLMPVFYGEVFHSGESYREYSEAISQNPAFTKQELKQGFVQGYIEMPIQGNLVQVQCRDPFLAFALLQAEARKLL